MSSMKEKLKAVAGAIAAIEKQFGKGSIMRLGEADVAKDIASVSTGSLGLDIALGANTRGRWLRVARSSKFVGPAVRGRGGTPQRRGRRCEERRKKVCEARHAASISHRGAHRYPAVVRDGGDSADYLNVYDTVVYRKRPRGS